VGKSHFSVGGLPVPLGAAVGTVLLAGELGVAEGLGTGALLLAEVLAERLVAGAGLVDALAVRVLGGAALLATGALLLAGLTVLEDTGLGAAEADAGPVDATAVG